MADDRWQNRIVCQSTEYLSVFRVCFLISSLTLNRARAALGFNSHLEVSPLIFQSWEVQVWHKQASRLRPTAEWVRSSPMLVA